MLTENEKRGLQEELAYFLVDNGLAEERGGHGHATGEQAAEYIMNSDWLKKLISTAVGENDLLEYHE